MGSLIATPSESVTEDGVGADQDKAAKAESEKDKIEHGDPPMSDGGEMARSP
ncbi:MAG: hypothetical protein AB7E81_17165 [Hyphomicrobiaceae bacterium]